MTMKGWIYPKLEKRPMTMKGWNFILGLEKWPMTIKGWFYPTIGKVANDKERMDLS
jgi:hypothetical protein